MGFNVSLGAITASSLLITAIFLVIMGILLTSAADKMTHIPEYQQSSRLQYNHGELKTAYILVFITAGIIALLAVLYAGQGIYWNITEWIHMFFFFVSFVLVVIAMFYAYAALNSIYNPDLSTQNGSNAYIWSSLLLGLISIVFIITVAAGRIGYNMVKGKIVNQWSKVKKNLGEAGYDVLDRVEYIASNITEPGFDIKSELNEVSATLRRGLNEQPYLPPPNVGPRSNMAGMAPPVSYDATSRGNYNSPAF